MVIHIGKGMVDSECDPKWKYDWTTKMTDNALFHDGIEFNMRVVDCGNGDKNSENCLFLNNSADVYTFIDVKDDNYISLELLANTDKQLPTTMDTRYIGIKLNYVDGTHEVTEIPISYCISEEGTSPVVSLSNKRDGSMAQISHLSVEINYYKKLDSFQILNERYVFDKESNGEYKKDENGDFITAKHSGATRKNRSHSSAVYAMTLVQNEEKTQEVIKEEAKKLYGEIYNDIEALGEITYEKKSDLDAITEKINKIIALELPVTKTEVANLDVYEAALTRWEELRIEKIINDISDMITDLGDIDSLTIEKEKDILDITNAIDAAIAEGVEINSDTVANYSDYERALIKLDELRIEKKKQDIIDAITALGDVEELTSDDLDKIEAIYKYRYG